MLKLFGFGRKKDKFKKYERKIQNLERMLRSFAAAKKSRLTDDWKTTSQSINEEIFGDLDRLRNRSRDLSLNNGYARKYLNMVKSGVVGPNGFTLQVRSRDDNGDLDEEANEKIETAWKKWTKPENFTVRKTLSFFDVQNMFAETLPRDGEFLIRIIRGFRNSFGFALQPIDIDFLDIKFNDKLRNGNTISMSIEYDEWSTPVAYHLLKRHPGSFRTAVESDQDRIRIPADQIIHCFVSSRASQTRGFPFMHASMLTLNHIDAYQEGELVAARVAANKMGFFESENGEDYVPDAVEEDGTLITEAEPGIFEQLPAGTKFTSFEPEHPAGNYDPFIKSNLRSISSGLDVSYHSLAQDLESVNFSSLRAGTLAERDTWRSLQTFTREHLLSRIYNEWLPFALLTQDLNLPIEKIDKFRVHWFQPRSFDWVDPKKDVEANILELQNGLKSRSDIIAEKGRDIKETFEKISKEEEMANNLNIDVSTKDNSEDEEDENDDSNNNNNNDEEE